MKKLKNTLKTMLLCMKIVLKIKEGVKYTLTKLFLTLFNNLWPIIFTLIPGYIVNELLDEKRINMLIIYVLTLSVVPFLSNIINLLSNRFIYILEDNLCIKLMADFYMILMRMDYETLENPDIQIKADRARGTYTCASSVIDLTIDFFTAVINVIIYSYIIINYNPIIILLIIAVICINFIVKKNVQEKLFDANKESDKCIRKLATVSYMFEQYDYGKEFRLFNLGQYLVDKYISLRKELGAIGLLKQKKNNTPNIVGSATGNLQQAALYAIFIIGIFRDKFSVGDLTIGLSAAGQFSGKLKSVFDSYLALYDRSMYIDEMEEFLSIPNRQYGIGEKKPIVRNESVIEFKNVSFKYPGSDNYALKNINIKIKADEKLCIVGANGAGKSTFIKLLTRLYSPTEGEILLNSININEYDYVTYQRLFAPVFQDFIMFKFPVKENIVLNNTVDNSLFEEVIEKVGLKEMLDKLPKGYDTQVGKYIDPEGIEPSGGEAQRMAIARALYHGGEIYLLDEPTAALDPLQEYEIYTQFNDMVTDKCAVLITHRLSAVQLADKVAVFDSGNIVEYGTHDELYKKDGIYTDMFNKQSEFYRRGTT